MNKKIPIILSFVFFLGCSSSEKRFENIVPGMDADAVQKTMKEGPTRFENISDTSYSSWYWDDEYCVLFNEGKVVAKDRKTEGRKVTVASGTYAENRNARCLAPGQTMKESGSARTINIPGVGTVTLPESQLRGPSSESTPSKSSGSEYESESY